MSFTGLLEGINERAKDYRDERAKQVERDDAAERASLMLIANSNDIEKPVRDRAATALLELSTGGKRPTKGGFLSRLFGADAIEPHPAVSQFMDWLKQPGTYGPQAASQTDAATPPASAPVAIGTTTPSQPSGPPAPVAIGDAEVAGAPQQGPGSRPVMPAPVAMPTPPSPPAVAAAPTPPLAVTAPPAPVPVASVATQGASAAQPTVPVAQGGGPASPAALGSPARTGGAAPAAAPAAGGPPRGIFRDPLEQAMTPLKAGWLAKAEVLRELKTPESEIQQIISRDIGGNRANGLPNQIVFGETQGADGVWRGTAANYDKVTGEATDLVTGEPLTSFRRAPTSTGAGSSGVNRDGAARALYGVPYAQLTTPEQRQKADAYAIQFSGDTAGSQTMGRGMAAAEIPLSTAQRATEEGRLRSDLERFTQTYRTTASQAAVIETAYRQAVENYRAGQPLGAQNQAIIQAFGRMIDPLSTVREAEYNRTPENASLLNRAEGKLLQWSQGGLLAPEELANVVSLAREIQDSYASFARNQASAARSSIRTYGLTETNVLTPDIQALLNANTPPPAGSPPGIVPGSGTPPPAANTPPPGAQTTPTTGQEYTGEVRVVDGVHYGRVNGQMVPLTNVNGKYYP